MSFADQVQASAAGMKKPLILCDVRGTLLLDEGENPNQPLITLLNHAAEQGFEVRLCTSGYDTGIWKYDREKLEGTNISPAILKNVGGKNIKPDTYSGVVAVIDDDKKERYVRNVIKGNPAAKHFAPDQIEELTRHLQVVKARVLSLRINAILPETYKILRIHCSAFMAVHISILQ